MRSIDRENINESMKGFFILKRSKNKYYGDVSNGKKCGIGFVKWEDGSLFKGQFEDNLVNGFGVFLDNELNTFTGIYNF